SRCSRLIPTAFALDVSVSLVGAHDPDEGRFACAADTEPSDQVRGIVRPRTLKIKLAVIAATSMGATMPDLGRPMLRSIGDLAARAEGAA
ncbi:hypothetical protein, partial [Streptomyces sp. NPDC057686]|uniref:hypothetical protein n=1 Tax=Streptomyces sp. NPDC057686 TaxID=3346212 RepID=UPI0036BB0606